MEQDGVKFRTVKDGYVLTWRPATPSAWRRAPADHKDIRFWGEVVYFLVLVGKEPLKEI